MLARMECKTDIIEDPFIAARMGKRDVGKADFQRFFFRKFRPERQRVACREREIEEFPQPADLLETEHGFGERGGDLVKI